MIGLLPLYLILVSMNRIHKGDPPRPAFTSFRKQMLKHQSHIRMEAKHSELESILTEGPSKVESDKIRSRARVPTKVPLSGVLRLTRASVRGVSL
jgi:hypothetical protein